MGSPFMVLKELARSAGAPAPHVLVAEDDLHLRTLLSATLQADGYRVTEVDNGEDLLHFLDATLRHGQEPALVISDDRMPKRRGLDVLKHVRALGWRLPLVLLTAYANGQVVDEAKEDRVFVMFKPFDLNDLRTVVQCLAPQP